MSGAEDMALPLAGDRATHERNPQAVSAVPVGIPSALEFRPDCDGEFDEIVARFADGMVHVETMSDKSCYVGFYWDDGRTCQWWISAKKKLRYHHESHDGDPPRFTAWGIDRHAQGGEAGTAETHSGSVHEHPVPVGDAPEIKDRGDDHGR